MAEKYIIIGAGGYAGTILSVFEDCIDAGMDYDVLGYIVEAQYGRSGILIDDKPILGDFEWLAKHKDEVVAVSAIGYSTVRRHLVHLAQEYGVRFGSIIHPSVIHTRRITVGKDVTITAGNIITNHVRIGDHVTIGPACTIGHNTVLKDFVSVMHGSNVSGNVILNEGCFIGAGATIVEKKTIGAWSVIGAGSVVVTDVPPYTVVVGNPAKVVKILNKDEIFAYKKTQGAL
jgi:sugar O-acyltransferase (sialic acid O-acetyltransferase NeuD family)